MAMTMTRWLLFATVAGLVAWLMLRGGSPPDGPEERIRTTLKQAAKAAEEKDIKGVMAIVSQDFRNDEGDRNTLKAFLFLKMQQGAWRRVFLVDTRVDLHPDSPPHRARVSTGAVLASGAEVQTLADVAPENAGVYRIDLEMLEENDGQWRVVNAKHQATDLSGLLGLPSINH